jgi:hypothetical protein
MWLDGWVHWLEAKGLTIKGGPMMMFTEEFLPDWLWIWENDFDTLRQYIADHIVRCVERYRGKIDHWDALSGLHLLNCMKFSLSQIMELTRTAARSVKQANPRATVVLDLVHPWGEYCATNPRSIWPLTYAEMCTNSDVDFDCIGLEIFMGAQGYHTRDLMNVSALLDQFDTLDKPVHITAVGVPSESTPDPDAGIPTGTGLQGGTWRRPWDEKTQSEWVDAFYRIAIGKPYVTAITWRDYSDYAGHFLPHAGLLRKNMTPKPALQKVMDLQRKIWPTNAVETPPDDFDWPDL